MVLYEWLEEAEDEASVVAMVWLAVEDGAASEEVSEVGSADEEASEASEAPEAVTVTHWVIFCSIIGFKVEVLVTVVPSSV